MKRPTPLTDKFIFDLKSRMLDAKINHRRLSKDIGVMEQHAYRWFKGLSKPTSEYLLKIQVWMKENL